MRVEAIINILIENYRWDDEIIVDWWDEEHFALWAESMGCPEINWLDVVIEYERNEGVDIGDDWLSIVDMLRKEQR